MKLNLYSVVNAQWKVLWCFPLSDPLSSTSKIDLKKGACHLVAVKRWREKKTIFSTMFSLFITKTDNWTISLIFFLIGKLQLHTARFLLKYTSNWIDILKKNTICGISNWYVAFYIRLQHDIVCLQTHDNKWYQIWESRSQPNVITNRQFNSLSNKNKFIILIISIL